MSIDQREDYICRIVCAFIRSGRYAHDEDLMICHAVDVVAKIEANSCSTIPDSPCAADEIGQMMKD